MGVRMKYPLYHRDQERVHQKGKKSSYMLSTLPLS